MNFKLPMLTSTKEERSRNLLYDYLSSALAIHTTAHILDIDNWHKNTKDVIEQLVYEVASKKLREAEDSNLYHALRQLFWICKNNDVKLKFTLETLIKQYQDGYMTDPNIVVSELKIED